MEVIDNLSKDMWVKAEPEKFPGKLIRRQAL